MGIFWINKSLDSNPNQVLLLFILSLTFYEVEIGFISFRNRAVFSALCSVLKEKRHPVTELIQDQTVHSDPVRSAGFGESVCSVSACPG